MKQTVGPGNRLANSLARRESTPTSTIPWAVAKSGKEGVVMKQRDGCCVSEQRYRVRWTMTLLNYALLPTTPDMSSQRKT